MKEWLQVSLELLEVLRNGKKLKSGPGDSSRLKMECLRLGEEFHELTDLGAG